ncbi:hypothetical protein B0G52_102329 [Cohnella sp. SGD-V74]|uniref:hypothetical protein n=1 Tax=unclassified Cohnella TaxID=2636738 RepID=UPI000D48899B|nr:MULTISPECIES: hypothetical protein [unclassified Cohnella]PRX74302.1 hypothetical protein B0G52_102329 [Cohnella sp. SGD-V74]
MFINLQDGVKAIFKWAGDDEERQSSHVVQMIEQAFVAALTFGRALLLLDRYFLSIPALQRLAEGDGAVHIVTKAKMNAVAYEKTVSFLCVDFLWGQGWYQELRFVLVRHAGRLAILVSTDLSLTATEIIELYGYRFWSASMPKLNRYRRKGEADSLEQVTTRQIGIGFD